MAPTPFATYCPAGDCLTLADALAALTTEVWRAGLRAELHLLPGVYDEATVGSVDSPDEAQPSDGRRRTQVTVAQGLVIDNRTLSSEVVFDAASGVVFLGRSTATSILTIHPLAPRVLIHGACFEGSALAPAITMGGAELSLIGTNFTRNAGSALEIQSGGNVIIAGSHLTENGGHLLSCGGAISVASGSLTIHESLIWGNTAMRGGALCITGQSTVHAAGATIETNNATRDGGGLYLVDDANVLLSNATKLIGNFAPTGLNIAFRSGELQYALPAPLGWWVPGVISCQFYRVPCANADPSCDPEAQPALNTQPCAPEYYGRHLSVFSLGSIDDAFPYQVER